MQQAITSRAGKRLTAVVGERSRQLRGDVVRVDGSQVTVLLAQVDRAAFPLGATVPLSLRIGTGPLVPFETVLSARIEPDAGVMLTLQLVRGWEIEDKLRRMMRAFPGRRQHVRVRPDPRHSVGLQILSRTPRNARVLNLSEGGMAYAIASRREPVDLTQRDHTLRLTTRVGGPWEVTARVRSRRVVESELQYGVEFMRPTSALVIGMRTIVQSVTR